MSMVLRVGVAGAGVIFEQHARAFAELSDRARIVALADVDTAKLQTAASRHSIPLTFGNHRELLRDDIDMVVVCTPPCAHEQPVVAALDAGKYVVCEKPLAHTLEAADRIIDAARRHPGKLSVVYQFRYLPEVRRTVWLRDNGFLGRPLFGRFHRFARFQRPGKPARAAWWGLWDVAGGGVVITQLIHELDLIGHVFGPAGEVWGLADTLKEEIESEDTCSATVRLASGAICSAHGTMSAHRSTAGFDVFGELASAHRPWALESTDPERRDQACRAAIAAYPDVEPEPASSAHTPYIAAVLDAIDEGRPLPIGPAEARASLELCTGIYASALCGAPISLPIDETNPYYGGITRGDYERREPTRSGLTVGP